MAKPQVQVFCSREHMRWPREGESMGEYREYVARLLVDYGDMVPRSVAEDLADALGELERASHLRVGLARSRSARIALAAYRERFPKPEPAREDRGTD